MQLTEGFKKQILLVEDEGLIAADIQGRLERLGYAPPTIASSGADALRRARCTPFDLVLMDIRLKGDVDGISTAQVLKDKLDTPVVYITAFADRETIDRAKLTEPLGYILKPVTDDDLRSVLELSLYRAEMDRRPRTSEAWLAAILRRSLGEGNIVTNTYGEIADMNRVAELMTGSSKADAMGCPIMEVLTLFEDSTAQAPGIPIHDLFDLFAGGNRSYTLIANQGVQLVVHVECSENCTGDDLVGSIVTVRIDSQATIARWTLSPKSGPSIDE